MYEERKRIEILWAGDLYRPFDYDEERFGWLRVLLPLPERKWNRDASELLILIPSHYPEIPPERFYLDSGLRDIRGKRPGHYFQANEYSSKGWAWFCLHLEKGWSPRERIEAGDNLVTVIERIQVGLSGR